MLKDKKAPGFLTQAIHAGNGVDKENGAIRRPITMANLSRGFPSGLFPIQRRP